MPRPRQYESLAAKQAAYRARQKTIAAARVAAGFPSTSPPAPVPALQYRQWRKVISEASSLLQAAYDSVDAWIDERSDRWHESDRGSELEADRDQLQEILDQLEGLSLLAPART